MNDYTDGPGGTDIHIRVPIALLAIAPALQGICLWGQRTGSADPYIEWLLNQLATQRRRRLRPVRLPANATPSSVTLTFANGDSSIGGLGAAAHTPNGAAAPKVLAQNPLPLLERARGGMLIIESADLVPRTTAAALVRSLARMPAHERPLLIARSEQHPSRWPLLADYCAFWVREPRPHALSCAGGVGLMDRSPGVRGSEPTGGIVQADPASLDVATARELTLPDDEKIAAAAALSQDIVLTPDVLQRIVRRTNQHRGTAPTNVHSVDLFLARAARVLAALHGDADIHSAHIDTAWRLVGAPRFADEDRDKPTSWLDPEDGSRDANERGAARATSTTNGSGMTEQMKSASTAPSSASTPSSDKPVDRSGGPSRSAAVVNEAFAVHRTPEPMDEPTMSDSPVENVGSPVPKAHEDGQAGRDPSRVIVVPPAALYSALSLPTADIGRRGLAPRAQPSATGTYAGIAPGYVPGHSVALASTLQAAIPWQRLRTPPAGRSAAPMVQVRPEDLRSYRRRPRPKVLYIMAVDGSGSMGRGRMQLAKGAALAVLAGAYKERRFVSLIDFRGYEATLMCPPGRSSAAIRRLITTMPSGGGTPLPAALVLARDVARRWLHNNPTGTAKLILFTDGKANVPLQAKHGSTGALELQREPTSGDTLSASIARRAATRRDTVEVAADLRDAGVHVRLVDTDGWRPSAELRDLAELLNAPIIRTSATSARRRGIGGRLG